MAGFSAQRFIIAALAMRLAKLGGSFGGRFFQNLQSTFSIYHTTSYQATCAGSASFRLSGFALRNLARLGEGRIFARSRLMPRELEIINGIAKHTKWAAEGGHETLRAKRAAGKKLR